MNYSDWAWVIDEYETLLFFSAIIIALTFSRRRFLAFPRIVAPIMCLVFVLIGVVLLLNAGDGMFDGNGIGGIVLIGLGSFGLMITILSNLLYVAVMCIWSKKRPEKVEI